MQKYERKQGRYEKLSFNRSDFQWFLKFAKLTDNVDDIFWWN